MQLQQKTMDNALAVQSLVGSKRPMIFEDEVNSRLREEAAVLFGEAKAFDITIRNPLELANNKIVKPYFIQEEDQSLILNPVVKKRIKDDWGLTQIIDSRSYLID